MRAYKDDIDPIRLSVSLDNEIIIKLQAHLIAKHKKRYTISDVVRLALFELAKAENIIEA